MNFGSIEGTSPNFGFVTCKMMKLQKIWHRKRSYGSYVLKLGKELCYLIIIRMILILVLHVKLFCPMHLDKNLESLHTYTRDWFQVFTQSFLEKLMAFIKQETRNGERQSFNFDDEKLL